MTIPTPSLSTLMKLGSIAVHADEYLGAGGSTFDADTIRNLLADPEVVAFLDEMTALALLPVKRA